MTNFVKYEESLLKNSNIKVEFKMFYDPIKYPEYEEIKIGTSKVIVFFNRETGAIHIKGVNFSWDHKWNFTTDPTFEDSLKIVIMNKRYWNEDKRYKEDQIILGHFLSIILQKKQFGIENNEI